MVAKRLSQVGGDGQAFRCGGEEFSIVFRNTSAKDAFEHLDGSARSSRNLHFRCAARKEEAREVPRVVATAGRASQIGESSQKSLQRRKMRPQIPANRLIAYR